MRRLAQLSGRDLLAAAAVLALGIFGMVEAMDYRLGELRNIGPGAFPLAVSTLLVVSGLLIAAEGTVAIRADRDQSAETAPVRVVIFIAAGLLAFAFLMPRFGLLPAIAACVGLSAFADGSLRLWQVALLAAAVAAFCAVVFVVLLNLPLDLVTW